MFHFLKKNQKPPSDAPEWWLEYLEATSGISNRNTVFDTKFTVLDIEATGLDVHQDRIISFASIPVFGEEMIPADSFQCLIRQEYFDKDSVPIHELRHADISHGMTESEFLKKAVSLLKGSVIVGHHVGYDVAMINKALDRMYGLKLINPVVETGALYKKTYPSQFSYRKYGPPVPSLDTLAAQFDLVFHDRHSAMGDTIMTALIFLKLIRKLKGKKKLLLKNIL